MKSHSFHKGSVFTFYAAVTVLVVKFDKNGSKQNNLILPKPTELTADAACALSSSHISMPSNNFVQNQFN